MHEAVDRMKIGKAAGIDRIKTEMLKQVGI